MILIATGSEVALAVEAHEKLVSDGIRLPRGQPALLGALRAPGAELPGRGASAGDPGAGLDRGGLYLGWDRFVGPEGATIGMHTFGSSAPLKDVQSKFGFTPDKVAETAKEVLGR